MFRIYLGWGFYFLPLCRWKTKLNVHNACVKCSHHFTVHVSFVLSGNLVSPHVLCMCVCLCCEPFTPFPCFYFSFVYMVVFLHFLFSFSSLICSSCCNFCHFSPINYSFIYLWFIRKSWMKPGATKKNVIKCEQYTTDQSRIYSHETLYSHPTNTHTHTHYASIFLHLSW